MAWSRLVPTWCVVGIASLIAVTAAGGQEPLVIPRLTGPIELDGRIDEPAWEAVEPLPMTMHAPTFNGTSTELSEIRVAYTDEFLYVAGHMYDSDPFGIQGPALNRDHLSTSSDWLAIVLDSFSDNENALVFGTTPSGLRTDYEVRDDTETPNNVSWNTHWDVAVQRNEEGWFAEFQIPFSSLRFQDDDGRVVMGLIIWRFIARKNEIHIFPEIPPQWGFFSINKPSQARDVVFEGVQRQNLAYLTPHILGGFGQSSDLTDEKTGYRLDSRTVREAGLDLKYSVTSNLTLDVTVNTDFAQVEADDQQVNLTRFSLFFPEKRQFFQERSSIFEFQTGEFDRLFHSRRIGFSEGRAIRIYGGSRLVGRVGEWDLGMLTLQTASDKALPSENFGVLRLRRRVLNPTSYLGGMLTTRVGADGSYNLAYGADGIFGLFGNDYMAFNLAHTLEDGTAAADGLESSLLRFSWERRTVVGLGYDLSVTRVGEAYNPAMGFVQRTGFLRMGDRLFYGWMSDDKSSVFRQMLSADAAVFLSTADGSLESYDVTGQWSLETKAGAELVLMGTRFFDRPMGAFLLSPNVEVPAGSYAFHQVSASYRWPWGSLLTGQANANAGSFYDGSRVSFSIRPRWHLSEHLELGSEYEINRIEFQERSQGLWAHIGRVRARAMLSTELTGETFVQYSSALDGVMANLRIRYNPREGNDFYLVYNYRINTDRGRLNPMLPLTESRTILLKYSHTFSTRLW